MTIVLVTAALVAFAFSEKFVQTRLERGSYIKHFED
jgi:hypothetical protein